MKKRTFKELFEAARKRDRYWVADAIHTFTEDLFRLLEKKGKTKTDLAKDLNVSPAYITRVFSGNANFTIESMVKMTRALGGRLHLHATNNPARGKSK